MSQSSRIVFVIVKIVKLLKENLRIQSWESCQKCQNFSIFFWNFVKIVLFVKIVKNTILQFKIVKNCQKVVQVMFPHHSDQISHCSQISRISLKCQKSKVAQSGEWVSESVNDKVTYWAVCGQLKTFFSRFNC